METGAEQKRAADERFGGKGVVVRIVARMATGEDGGEGGRGEGAAAALDKGVARVQARWRPEKNMWWRAG